LTTDDSTKHPHSSDALHQSYHSPAAHPPPPEDDPPFKSVAHKPDEQSKEAKAALDKLADFNQKLAIANCHASPNLGTLVSLGSEQQKPVTTSTGTDSINQNSGLSWCTPFNPNPQPKDPPHNDLLPEAIDLTAPDSSPSHLCPPYLTSCSSTPFLI